MILDPSSLERRRGSAMHHHLVSESELFRRWLDQVRGRVGSAVYLPWWIAREKFRPADYRAWYDAGDAPEMAAARLIAAWMGEHEFDAPLI